jgi:hypothetical protein
MLAQRKGIAMKLSKLPILLPAFLFVIACDYGQDVQGTDEHGRERVAGFSDQQLSTFAFEIRMKSADKNGQIKFNQNLGESLLDSG